MSIPYILRRSTKRLTSTSIRVNEDGEVEVTAPIWVGRFFIDQFIEKQSAWINKRLQKPRVATKKYFDGEMHSFFGEEYPLMIIKTVNKTTKIKLSYGHLEAHVYGGYDDTTIAANIKKSLSKWYLENGHKVITEKVNHFTSQLDVAYGRITLKKVTSIWGSCSHKQNLNFNRKLILAPHPIVDYVVVHEVCHLIHKHHRRTFWELVEKLDPEYREHRYWLKKNDNLLVF